ncbi:ADP-ribosylglycohydrolase family protein [Streptomyces sp. NPDC053728]|uniref:ADP-ribosylglycohydrolase family protein n=1 Tax=Streptomyces sp. NPDC053728 TaxID=3155534 RepID=UPI0034453A9E
MTPTSPEDRALRPHGRSGAGHGARAVGAVVGSAVGDALGAPFEFGLPCVWSARFPDGAGAPTG